MLRQHQAELLTLCQEINSGHRTGLERIICLVTPGGGKSLLPLIVASQLIPSVADKVCWVVPRLSLQQQAEREFYKPAFRRLLDHQHEVRQSTNEVDPTRGLSGYVTTYQAIGNNPALHAREFAQHRYALIMDEPHHVEEDGSWQDALAPLIDRAALVLSMSGTLERGNRRRIAFLPYHQQGQGEVVDLTTTATTAVIGYSRAQALREQSIIPLYFRHFDARTEWINGCGQVRTAATLNEAGSEAQQALYTALNTRYAFQLLDAAVVDWQAYKQHNPRAKLLVVASAVSAAREYVRHLKAAGVGAEIATSLESEQAVRHIERFRKVSTPDAIDCLVTVAMAYEGLDVPAITHLACLTHIRSRPWIEQMLARATRYDPKGPPYAEQVAYAYVPDDPLMMQIIHDLAGEQARCVSRREQAVAVGALTSLGPAIVPQPIVPCDSWVTQQRATALSDSVDLLGYEETTRIQSAMERHGIRGLSPLQLKRAMAEVIAPSHMDESTTASGPSPPTALLEEADDAAREDEPLLTSTERERRLRQAIQKHCGAVDGGMNWSPGSTNRLVHQSFGKSRETMTVAELMEVWMWLQQNHPKRRLYRGLSPIEQRNIQ